ncbi:MAG TPA: ABC transporter ATP-binding protein [Roseiflexaceae bacterium]|nr:ABC transporter ATP-binding protein [Roseiflexaceae bacterium]
MSEVITFERVSKKFVLRRDRRGAQGRAGGLLRRRPPGEEFWALRDVSFGVQRGQSLGLVGHNGAGKSTALKLMTRILEPTSGRVALRGRVAALLELGSGFHPDLSGRENVFLYGSLLGLSRREMSARMDEIVAFSDIGDFLDMEVKHYSSGMYTRLAFAVATSVDPEVLITDEVLAVGDEAFQRKCMERIYSFRQQGRTIVFVSHALDTIRTLCDTAVWLDHGVARAVGPAAEVVDAYLAEVNRREQEELERRGAISPADAGPLQRYGGREVEITGVELLDGQGRPHSVFRACEPLTVRIRYVAHVPAHRPIFGLALHHEGGLLLSGPNTRFFGLDIPQVRGAGHVDYTIPSLPLLGGRYLLSAAVYDDTMLHAYDHHDRLYRLTVQSDHLPDRFGALALAGTWSWEEREGRAGEALPETLPPNRHVS